MDSKDKLVLADGTEITLETSQGIGALTVCVESRAAAGALWEQLTPDNLSEIAIVTGEEVTGTYKDLLLDHVTGTDGDGGMTTLLTISLRTKTENEILRDQVRALETKISNLEAGQGTQDEAISDLGQAVSDIAEGGAQ